MKKIITQCCILLTALLSHFIPVSYIVGSWKAYFSISTVLAPVLMNYGSWFSMVFFLIPCKKITVMTLFPFLLHHLPLMFSVLAYQYRNLFTWVFLPALCIMLFASHAVGFQALPYVSYWFIPMVLFFIRPLFFSNALASVFVAHGVGSVLYLYTRDLSSVMWIGLIPIVAIERLLMAGLIVVSDAMIKMILRHLNLGLTHCWRNLVVKMSS